MLLNPSIDIDSSDFHVFVVHIAISRRYHFQYAVKVILDLDVHYGKSDIFSYDSIALTKRRDRLETVESGGRCSGV